MNYRKFCLILSLIISVFLFFSGTFILSHLNSINVSANAVFDEDNGVNDLLKPFIKDNKINVLLLVGDIEEANTDTIMLASLDTRDNTLNVLSIPRDTRVDIDSMDFPKINSLYAKKNGHILLVDTLNKMFGVKIDYYVYLNIKTFREIINKLDGVYIDVPVDMDYDDPTQNLHIHLKKGHQLLDGEKAEQYLRFRHPNGPYYSEEMLKHYDGSDLKRINAQQNFIKELIKQKANITYISRLDDIINTVFDNMETDITLSEALKILKSAASYKPETLNTYTLPGESKQMGTDNIWYYIYDKEQGELILKDKFR
jgi:LCP family protein required for cell wall assembly